MEPGLRRTSKGRATTIGLSLAFFLLAAASPGASAAALFCSSDLGLVTLLLGDATAGNGSQARQMLGQS